MARLRSGLFASAVGARRRGAASMDPRVAIADPVAEQLRTPPEVAVCRPGHDRTGELGTHRKLALTR